MEFQGFSKEVQRVFQGNFEGFYGKFKVVSKVFQGGFRIVSRMFQENFKEF